MQVKFYASFRQAVGTKMVEVDVQAGSSIRQVLQEITGRFPVLQTLLWKNESELSDLAHVFINGVNIRHLQGLESALKADDHVDIFPPLVGG